MIGAIVLFLLCLALASLVLRVGLFFLGKEEGRLAKTTSIAQSIGMVPVTTIAWALNTLQICLLILMFAYFVAPDSITEFLARMILPQ